MDRYRAELASLPAERWVASADPDVRWVVRENLGKARLERMDADWVDELLAVLATR